MLVVVRGEVRGAGCGEGRRLARPETRREEGELRGCQHHVLSTQYAARVPSCNAFAGGSLSLAKWQPETREPTVCEAGGCSSRSKVSPCYGIIAAVHCLLSACLLSLSKGCDSDRGQPECSIVRCATLEAWQDGLPPCVAALTSELERNFQR
jgi:hypothetical protein